MYNDVVADFLLCEYRKHVTVKMRRNENAPLLLRLFINKPLSSYYIILDCIIAIYMERRASMSMSMGALTAFLCMLRAKGKYRKKWEAAVLKALSHIPAISDFVQLTESDSSAGTVKPMLGLLGDILLITTSKQSQRGCKEKYCFNLCS